jgi:hypothetical protein
MRAREREYRSQIENAGMVPENLSLINFIADFLEKKLPISK